MGMLDGVMRWLDDEFAELAAGADVPGTAVAVLAGDELVERATGVLSKRTGVAATTDSVFQIGSITKVWTATLVMQLVDDGLLDLDAPVRTYLPGFRVADEQASATITTRHLLTHTSGIEGDIFTEVGCGDDAIERFCAELLPPAGQLFPPGELFSYCNAGFTALGRVIELLAGKPFNDVLVDRLAKPLGLSSVSPRAENAILHRAAVGHLPSGDGEWAPVPTWARGFAGLPSGSMLAMSAADLIGFARMHLRGGEADDGTRILSEQSVRAMRVPLVQLPPLGEGVVHRGLGWTLEGWPGGTVIGHDGGTTGYAAYFRVVPEHDLAIALLTNGGRAGELVRAVFTYALNELAGIRLPDPPVPPSEHTQPVDPHRYTGRYETAVIRFDIAADADGELWSETSLLGELAKRTGQTTAERERIVRLDGDTFVVAGQGSAVTFVGDDGTGRARFLHSGRAIPRVR